MADLTTMYSRNTYSFTQAEKQVETTKKLLQATGWVRLPVDDAFRARAISVVSAVWGTDMTPIKNNRSGHRYRLRIHTHLPAWALTCKEKDLVTLATSRDERIMHLVERRCNDKFTTFHGAINLLLSSIREGKEYGYDVPAKSFVEASTEKRNNP
jgi:hypothetical protein